MERNGSTGSGNGRRVERDDIENSSSVLETVVADRRSGFVVSYEYFFGTDACSVSKWNGAGRSRAEPVIAVAEREHGAEKCARVLLLLYSVPSS